MLPQLLSDLKSFNASISINQSKPVRKFVKHTCAGFLAPTNYDCTSVCTILNKENRFQMINQNRCRI